MALPARKLRRSAVKNIVRVPSTKSGLSEFGEYKSILVESILESQYCLHLEFDQSVAQYFPQPKTFQIALRDGQVVRYIPDFEVLYTSGAREYIEVKPHKFASSPRAVELFTCFQSAVQVERSRFKVVDEYAIPRQLKLIDVEKILRKEACLREIYTWIALHIGA